jgi:hypothetical protein
LSRSIYLIELDALNPIGRLSIAEIVAEIRDRFSFSQIPSNMEDAGTDKGAAFLSGRMDDIVIDKLTLYHNGIVVDTRRSTYDSESVAANLIQLSRELLGSRATVARKHFVSQIVFKSDMRLAKTNPVLEEIAKTMEHSLSEDLGQGFIVEPTTITVYIDVTQARIGPAKFTIERRAESPFSEKLYFSSAPLHTDIHLELVDKFEKSLL